MASITTDAIVLHAFDYLETSRILRLATRELGVQSVIARGARRSSRRFGAALDLFASGTAEIHSKAGRELQQLTTFDVTNPRPSLGLDLDRFSGASMLAELGLRFAVAEEQGNLFASLSEALDVLTTRSGVGARSTALGRAWHLIAAMGFAPSIDLCCVCHEPLPPAEAALFSYAEGGVVCERCAPVVRSGRRLPAEARGTIREWLRGDDLSHSDAAVMRAHARLLREFVVHHISDGAELRAFSGWTRRFDQ